MDKVIHTAYFDLRRTLGCGQCFRWRETAGGFEGIVCGKKILLSQAGGTVTLHGVKETDIPFWREYFDLDTDYSEIISRLSQDETLKKACECSSGIRILRQEPFETLLSFIISQNNNIPRIQGIIERLCENFGEKTEGGYAFPDGKRLDGVTESDLAPLKAGFRARYLCDAVRKVNSGEIDFCEIDGLPTDKAREQLKKITGVGDKVADCVLLFAFYKTDAFPRDVWVKRLMERFYPDGLPDCAKGIEGIAQQFLFDYVRNNGGLIENDNSRVLVKG